LWVVDPAGGASTAVFSRGDDRDLGEPAWSPDGTRIAYVERGDPAGPDAGTRNLYVRWLDGSGTTQLTSGGSVWGFDWSPDGSQIVYSLGADDDSADLWLVGSGGGAPVLLHDPGGAFGAVEPIFSPDGSTIAFERGTRVDGIFWQSDLFVMPSGGGAPAPAVAVPMAAGAVNHSHSFSPDGSRLAYSSSFEDGGGVVWVVDLATGTELAVSGAVEEAQAAAWSPAGDRITFFGWDGGTGLWVVGSDGTGLTPLPASPQWGTDLSWSADGARIVYTGDTPASGDGVWVIATGGSPPVQVSTLAGREFDGDWSP
jgi:Tol biopolymer transport system component